MGLLETIREPADVKRLAPEQLDTLAAEIRTFLIAAVSRTGGHLGPNLGAVELTIALHRVFDSPSDRIVWDTGHQSYVHKILTGRAERFETLRRRGGLSGYPCRAESEHDIVENSHASTALSYADGLAKAHRIRGLKGRHVVAVVGDGALTGGMAWEAVNNIAAAPDRPVIIVVNDNERSYSPTIGGLARQLAALRTAPGYERFLSGGTQMLRRTPVFGSALYDTLHGVKKGVKDIVAPQGLFEDLGLKYLGPIDGHDTAATEWALSQAKAFGGPVIVHCITRKGQGYEHAEKDEVDRFHAIGVNDPVTGQPVTASAASWTSVFAEQIVTLGRRREDLVAVTAAMPIPVGLRRFAEQFPDRVFDVGIAEQHAVTSAAGMAMGGLHPVVAVYSTFLNRAFDQLLMDVALHRCPVTFVLDRAGVTGDDGASHNGMWDLSILQVVPGLRVAAPRDGAALRAQLTEAVAVADGPTALRFPKGPVGADIPALDRIGGVDVLRRADGDDADSDDADSDDPDKPETADGDVLLVAVGAMAPLCLEIADRLGDQGIGVTVVDPRWVKPIDEALVRLADEHRLVVTVEDSGRVGGVGSTLAQALRDARVATPVRDFGIPQRFLDHAKRPEVLAECGLTAQQIAREVVGLMAALDAGRSQQPHPVD